MRPLDGIKVLDFTHALAGPFCTYHLGLLGADVVKIERPGFGDDFRHYTAHGGIKLMSGPFIAANAGKRSLTLDLKSPDAREVVRRLVLRSDVVVENFRPGVAKTLGIDAAALQAINSKLVYASISGFGQTGVMRDWPAIDHIVQAISGLMQVNGEPDQDPLRVGIPIADTFSGFLAAYSILAALLQRASSGIGQVIDVGMLDAALVMMSQIIPGVALTGEPPKRSGNRGFRMVAGSDTYKTRDGFICIGANWQPQFEGLCRVLGEEWLLSDPRFIDDDARMKNTVALRAELQRAFAGKSAADLEGKLAKAKVPAGKVRNLLETMSHPHVAEREFFNTADVPGLDTPATLAGAGFRFAHDGPVRNNAVATIGQHTDKVLAELGFTSSEIEGLRTSGAV
jgi:crotonobetainyl-CoA:carnitine CoA-transferase CaiB-like acyl-CoA transferase